MKRRPVTLGLVLTAVSCFGTTEILDFTEWDSPNELPGGWNESGMKQYVAEPLIGAAYFNGEGDEIISPVFPDSIMSVTVESATRQAGLTRRVTLTPVVNGRKQAGQYLKPPGGTAYEEQEVDLASIGANKFILTSSAGTGNWAVRRITVVYGNHVESNQTVRTVGRITVTGTEPNRFTLSWDPVKGAVGYVVNVWTNESDVVHAGVVQTETRFECAADRVVHNYSVAVRFSVDDEMVDSAAVVGAVDMSDPPWLRCWSLSAFLPMPGFRRADFSSLGTLEKMREWSNGVDGDFFYAFKDSGPVTVIRPARESSVYADLYCYNAGTESAPTNGLAVLGSKSTGLRLVLPVRLNGVEIPETVSVGYAVCEVRRGTSEQTALSFAWTAVDDMLTMDGSDVVWTTIPEATYLTTEGRAVRHVELPVKALRESAYVCLRWSVGRQPNSSIVGISDIALSGSLRGAGFVVTVK